MRPGTTSRIFSTTVSVSNSEKCWKTMPMPLRLASAGEARRKGSPSQTTVPVIRLLDAIDQFHQRRFARPVFSEDRMDRLRRHVQIDGLIGMDLAVALRNAAQRQERAWS